MNILVRRAAKFLSKRGYKVSSAKPESHDGYALFSYRNYDHYRDVQIAGNKRKIHCTFADEITISAISDYLRPFKPSRGICHGARNAAEVHWFRSHLECEVIGTDISDNASEFGLVQWDFHDTNPDWEGAFDFVYSNSFDHSYDPKKMLDNWVSQLAPGGRVFLEHTFSHSPGWLNELDPFGVELRELPYVVLSLSGGNYFVTDIIRPGVEKADAPLAVFVIQKSSDSTDKNKNL